MTLYAFRELIETVEQNTYLRKQVSDLTAQNQQQVSPENNMQIRNILHNSSAAHFLNVVV